MVKTAQRKVLLGEAALVLTRTLQLIAISLLLLMAIPFSIHLALSGRQGAVSWLAHISESPASDALYQFAALCSLLTVMAALLFIAQRKLDQWLDPDRIVAAVGAHLITVLGEDKAQEYYVAVRDTVERNRKSVGRRALIELVNTQLRMAGQFKTQSWLYADSKLVTAYVLPGK